MWLRCYAGVCRRCRQNRAGGVLSRITFPFLLLVSIVSFQSGILNSFRKICRAGRRAGDPQFDHDCFGMGVYAGDEYPVYRIACGVTLAGVFEIMWLNLFLRREGVKIVPQYHILTLLRSEEIRILFKRIAPGILGAGVYQINMMVDTILVSMVGTGAISWLYYANRLQQLPLGVVGAAIGVAVLPVLSRQLKAGDDGQARQTQDKAIEYGAILSIPAAVALIILAEPIINILFQHGKFGALQTADDGAGGGRICDRAAGVCDGQGHDAQFLCPLRYQNPGQVQRGGIVGQPQLFAAADEAVRPCGNCDGDHACGFHFFYQYVHGLKNAVSGVFRRRWSE